MTAFGASLFALAALASAWVIAASWLGYGREALALRARLDACPETMMLTWRMIERVPLPALTTLRTDRNANSHRCRQRRPGLEWPAPDRQFELAA